MSQPVLALLPAEARSIGPSAGLLEGADGGVVFVFGWATFSYAASDQTGRRLAAVQLVRSKTASATEVASAFAVSQATLWRWVGAFNAGGVDALVRERPGPKRPSKLTAALSARIVELAAGGLTLQQVGEQVGVSTATVRVALGRVSSPAPKPTEPVGAGVDLQEEALAEGDIEDPDVQSAFTEEAEPDPDVAADAAEGPEALAALVPLAVPVPRTAERAAARFGDLVEAPVVITQGSGLPLAGLLLALPTLETTGLLDVATQVFPPMRKGFYGLRVTLLMAFFMALLREPRAEGATRLRPADLGRVLGLDRAPEVKTLRRKLADIPC